MANAIQVFNFEQRDVRIVERAGEPWFVAKDVCDVLGLTNPRDAIGALDDDEKGVAKTDTLGGKQGMNIISESGVYALIFRSNKADARRFRKWVTAEVLPEIRRTGRYTLSRTDYRIAAGKLVLEGLEAFSDVMPPEHKAVLLDRFTKVVVPSSFGRKYAPHKPAEPLKDKDGKPLYTARGLARELGVLVNRICRASKRHGLKNSDKYGEWRKTPYGDRFFYNETARDWLKQYFV